MNAITLSASPRRPAVRKPPASREQVVALLAQYQLLSHAGDPRTCSLNTGKPFGDDREGRLNWAAAYLGKAAICSFNDLDLLQASYLLDLLIRGRTKLDDALGAEFKRLRIMQPEPWFAAMIGSEGERRHPGVFWKFRGLKLSQLNRWHKWKLLSILKTRAPVRSTAGSPESV